MNRSTFLFHILDNTCVYSVLPFVKVRSPVILSPRNLERRVSCPATATPTTSHISTINNLDEPDWLREIDEFSARIRGDPPSSAHPSSVASDGEVAIGHVSSTRGPG